MNERKRQCQGLSDDTLYKIVRDDMIESYTRLSNTKHWSIVICCGVFLSMANLYHNDGYLLLCMIFTAAVFLNLQLSRFVLGNVSFIEYASAYLHALEKLHGKDHWIGNTFQKRRESETYCPNLFTMSLIDSFWDLPTVTSVFYFLGSVVTITRYLQHHSWTLPDCLTSILFGMLITVCFLCLFLIFLTNYLAQKEYVKNYPAYYKALCVWMKDPKDEKAHLLARKLTITQRLLVL